MEKAGLSVREDAVGNIFGRWWVQTFGIIAYQIDLYSSQLLIWNWNYEALWQTSVFYILK